MAKTKEKKRIRLEVAFGIMVVLMVAILAVFAWTVSDVQSLEQENQDRISDIQSSRIESCKTTYAGIQGAFAPFYPPPPRTKKQEDDLKAFKDNIRNLERGCEAQILHPKKVKRKPDKG